MSILGELGHPELLPLIKTYHPGEFLFKQGELANSMILIAAGDVCLFSETDKRSQLVGIAKTGEVLGEKLILNDKKYPRALSAQAASLTTVLEMGHADISQLTEDSPDILKELLINVVQVLSRRFDNSSTLIRVLRPQELNKRLVLLISYLAETTGVPTAKGREVLLTFDTLEHYLEVDKKTVKEVFSELASKGLIEKLSDAKYLVASAQALRASIESQPPPLSKHSKSA